MREGFVGAFPILLNRSLATFVLNNSYSIASVFLANVWNTFQSADKKSQEKNLIYRSNHLTNFQFWQKIWWAPGSDQSASTSHQARKNWIDLHRSHVCLSSIIAITNMNIYWVLFYTSKLIINLLLDSLEYSILGYFTYASLVLCI